jgi:hypothetical protein
MIFKLLVPVTVFAGAIASPKAAKANNAISNPGAM